MSPAALKVAAASLMLALLTTNPASMDIIQDGAPSVPHPAGSDDPDESPPTGTSNAVPPPSSSGPSSRDEGAFIVGGVWRLGSVTQDVTLNFSYVMPSGRAMFQLVIAVLDPQNGSREMLEVMRSRQGEAGFWIGMHGHNHSFSQDLPSSGEPVNVSYSMGTQHGLQEGRLLVFLLHATSPASLRYEIWNLPPNTTRLDHDKWYGTLDYAGAGISGPMGHLSVQKAQTTFETTDCTYGTIGLVEHGLVHASSFELTGPTKGRERGDFWGPRFLLWGVEPGTWQVSSEWTGAGYASPLPYIALLSGECP